MLRCNGWLFGFESRFVRHVRATERADAERDGGCFGVERGGPAERGAEAAQQRVRRNEQQHTLPTCVALRTGGHCDAHPRLLGA
jgi:hypothetical protein